MMRTGGLRSLHHADLHRRRVRAQHAAAFDEERVLHVARRMVGGNVERLEVVVVVLDFRPLGDLEAQSAEDLADLRRRPRERMDAPGGSPYAGSVTSTGDPTAASARELSASSAVAPRDRSGSLPSQTLTRWPKPGRSSAGKLDTARAARRSARPSCRGTRPAASRARARSAALPTRARRRRATSREIVFESRPRRPVRLRQRACDFAS